MNITAVARTFLISFLVIFCLTLPAQAEKVSAGHFTPHTFGQVTTNQTGINAYRRNLNRLRGIEKEESRSQPPSFSPTAKELSEPPQLSGSNPPNSEPSKVQRQQQQAQSTKQQQKFSFTKVFQKNNSKKIKLTENSPETGNPSAATPTQTGKERPTQPQGMTAYEMVEAARSPYGNQAGTAFSRPSFPQITPEQLSEQFSKKVSQLHTSIRQQPERINKTVVEPLQGKIATLKEQASTTAKTTFKEQIESRSVQGRELIESSGVNDRIRQTKTTLKDSVVGMLKHVETKAHETAEQLNDTAH